MTQFGDFSVAFPEEENDISQAEEWCVVRCGKKRPRRIRFHDYHKIYNIPGLYEFLFYERLRCQSPAVICRFLRRELEKSGKSPATLKVMDLGAGNGMVAEELAKLGVQNIVGVDILREAKRAALRDRPGVYHDYHAVDMTRLPRRVLSLFKKEGFNCLVSVAALGFGDIPHRAFAQAYNLIDDSGWIAFTIKEDFLHKRYTHGFSKMIQKMARSGLLDLRLRRRYHHRLSVAGKPLSYVGMVGVKKGNISRSILKTCD
ncbi:MAG: class I SAM-dependent methyltransferase [Deltaproteobacteria bacterium]|nr:class I SAM-dependent methyltransferase [Deltaproteobacteria bacterium]